MRRRKKNHVNSEIRKLIHDEKCCTFYRASTISSFFVLFSQFHPIPFFLSSFSSSLHEQFSRVKYSAHIIIQTQVEAESLNKSNREQKERTAKREKCCKQAVISIWHVVS